MVDAPEQPRGWALMAHCFTCSKDLKGLRGLAHTLVEQGLGVFRIDFTGLGESDGEFHEGTFGTNVSDLEDAAEFLASEWGEVVLGVGHSLGGAAMIHASSRITSMRAVATLGAPSEPVMVTRHFSGKEDEIREEGSAEVVLAGRPFTITREFLESLEAGRMRGVLANLRVPLLVMHSAQDRVVSLEHATAIFRAVQGNRSFVSLDGADHLLSRSEDAAYAGRVIGAWASRYF